jgi:hypothetical protein
MARVFACGDDGLVARGESDQELTVRQFTVAYVDLLGNLSRREVAEIRAKPEQEERRTSEGVAVRRALTRRR